MGEYQLAWWKTIDTLKHNGHFLFKGQEIWEGIHDEDIEVAYQRLMSPSNNLTEMSLFFFDVQIKVIKDMVCEDICMFQENWEQTDEE